jgi:hypothetical protein
VLQTYLPFVLALPFVSLASLMGEALRAANRTLGIVVAAYAVNLSILLAVLLAPPDASLVLYSWAFFLGSLVAAAIAAALAWQAFPATRAEAAAGPISREVLQAVDSRELVGLAPETLRVYGTPYDAQVTIYALLLGVQWANGVGRPAVRQAVVDWDARRIGVTLGSGALAVVLICALGVTTYGALAAAAASLVGTLILNARAIVMALSNRHPGESQSGSPSPRGTV